ncbi:MAG: T9SS type A sorting domain-containing protein [Lewinellaceae bacterium]|nr:T9SS type A sorting domain-containing protein [Lewinellaceae bacterium]
MRISLPIFFPVLIFLAHPALAQDEMFQRMEVPASINGKNLKYAFAGGLNNAQFSSADLNNDGIQDLVVFDRAGNVVLTFLNDGTIGVNGYTYAPEYACNFPKLVDYALMRDYNQDGAADIFCASLQDGSQEMQVFRGYYENNMLKFTPFKFYYPICPACDPYLIWYPSNQPGFLNNLSIAKTDIPSVDDIDGDGDLDIVTFAAGNTTHLWFLRNESVEKGYGLDSLQFTRVDDCWGKFYENGLEACRATLSDDPNCCAPCFGGPEDESADDREARHPGAAVLTYDQDNDGDKDLLLGNLSFECLGMFTNGGSTNQAWMTGLDTLFPSYDVLVQLYTFPAAYHLDIDNDGKKDLLISPNSKSISEDRTCVWYYRNTASTGTHFELQTKSLFVDEMIDLGTVTHPVVADVNGDGLPDLVVGNNGYYIPFDPGNSNNSSLYLFLNVGTPWQPRFDLVDTDWLGMSQYSPNDYDFAPTFGDIDGDNDLDLLIGNYGGWLYCFRNTAGPNNPMTFQQDFNPMWVSMDVGSSSTPVIFDLDGDGLNDILMGEFQGNINFFKNTGTATQPAFSNQPSIAKIGGVDTEIIVNGVGYSAPTVVITPDGPNLITGGVNGKIEVYDNISATADPFSEISLNWGNTDDGERSSPAFADLDFDGILEMVDGNLRGGLNIYKTVLVDCTTPTTTVDTPAPVLQLSPNPTSAWVRVQLPEPAPAQWRAYNALGQLMASGNSADSPFSISVRNWEPGVYFVEVTAAGQHITGKLLVRYE